MVAGRCDIPYIRSDTAPKGAFHMSNKGLSYVSYGLLFALILYVGFGWGVA